MWSGRVLLATVMAAMLATPGRAPAQALRYLGPTADGRRGRIEVDGRSAEVRKGEAIPGVGTVQKVTTNYVVVRRPPVVSESPLGTGTGVIAQYDEVFQRHTGESDTDKAAP